MEFRLRHLGLMDFFAKQQSCCFAKNSMKSDGRSLYSMN